MVKFETTCTEAEVRQLLGLLVVLGGIEGKPLVSNRQQCRAAFAAVTLNPTLTGKSANSLVTLTWTKNTGMIQVQTTAHLMQDVEERARGLDRFFHDERLAEYPEAADRISEHLASESYSASGPVDDSVYLSAIQDIADHASTVLESYPLELSRLLAVLRRDFGLGAGTSFPEFMHVSPPTEAPPCPKARARRP